MSKTTRIPVLTIDTQTQQVNTLPRIGAGNFVAWLSTHGYQLDTLTPLGQTNFISLYHNSRDRLWAVYCPPWLGCVESECLYHNFPDREQALQLVTQLHQEMTTDEYAAKAAIARASFELEVP